MLKRFIHCLLVTAFMLPFFHRHEHVHTCHDEIQSHASSINAVEHDHGDECGLCTFLLTSKKPFQQTVSFLSEPEFFTLSCFNTSLTIQSRFYSIDGNRSPPQNV
ncbi:MAG TPA: hypothetical protein PKB05_01950 [Oligoflexia bacterium]|nr:hypothetical protein [Oligoflexia bacterium]